MGLDISAYRKLTLDPKATIDAYDYPFVVRVWDNDAFPGRAKPFEHKSFYRSQDKRFSFGTVAAKRLARDFAKYQTLADKHTDGWFKGKYKEWRKAFEIASDNGLVNFG